MLVMNNDNTNMHGNITCVFNFFWLVRSVSNTTSHLMTVLINIEYEKMKRRCEFVVSLHTTANPALSLINHAPCKSKNGFPAVHSGFVVDGVIASSKLHLHDAPYGLTHTHSSCRYSPNFIQPVWVRKVSTLVCVIHLL